jgi:hypothetical protein
VGAEVIVVGPCHPDVEERRAVPDAIDAERPASKWVAGQSENRCASPFSSSDECVELNRHAVWSHVLAHRSAARHG